VPQGQHGRPPAARHWSLPLLLGAVIGTLVTLTSVGAGAIGVTVLLLVYPLLPLPRIVGADIAYAVPLTLVAGLGHASAGLGGLAAAGTIAGRLAARHLAGLAPDVPAPPSAWSAPCCPAAGLCGASN
jgi:uncharacterized membrane protein YfcA